MESSSHDPGSRRAAHPTTRGRGTSRTSEPRTAQDGQRARHSQRSQGDVPDKVTPAQPSALTNLKDVVSASRSTRGLPQPPGAGPQGGGGPRSSAKSLDGRDPSSTSSNKANVRREARQGGGTRTGSEDERKKGSRASQQPSDRTRPSKTQTTPSSSTPKPMDGDGKGKAVSSNNSMSNNTARSKSGTKSAADSQDSAKTGGRSPGKLKKSMSTGGESWDRESQHVQPSNASSKTPPPRAKKKAHRGRTVHDSSEFGEVREKPGNDVTRTSQPTSPSRDVNGAGLRASRRASGSTPSATTTTIPTTRVELSQLTSLADVHENLSSPASLSPPPSAPALPGGSSRATTTTNTNTNNNAYHVRLVPELSQQSFFSLNKVPSRSSTSSDVQSEVCVDLPDYTELPADAPTEEREGFSERAMGLGFPSAPYKRITGVARHRRPGAVCLTAMGTAAVFVVSLLLFLPVLALVLLLVPLCLFCKWLCSLCCCCGPLWGRCCIGCCHTHLTASERLWVTEKGGGGGGSSRLPPVAQCVIVLQKGLSTERLRHLLDARLLSLENRHGRRVYPRFTQRVESFCCGYAWVPDPRFAVHNHVFNMPGYIESLEDLQVSVL